MHFYILYFLKYLKIFLAAHALDNDTTVSIPLCSCTNINLNNLPHTNNELTSNENTDGKIFVDCFVPPENTILDLSFHYTADFYVQKAYNDFQKNIAQFLHNFDYIRAFDTTNVDISLYRQSFGLERRNSEPKDSFYRTIKAIIHAYSFNGNHFFTIGEWLQNYINNTTQLPQYICKKLEFVQKNLNLLARYNSYLPFVENCRKTYTDLFLSTRDYIKYSLQKIYKKRYVTMKLNNKSKPFEENIQALLSKSAIKCFFSSEAILLNLYCILKMHIIHNCTIKKGINYECSQKDDVFLFKMCLFCNEMLFKNINADHAILKKEECEWFLESIRNV